MKIWRMSEHKCIMKKRDYKKCVELHKKVAYYKISLHVIRHLCTSHT
ncbi:hypothetical protein J2T12_002538 [Paenibacillus anaericanus]|nr:hypothetical protein [Paenibacillus anaericanus]